MKHAAVDPGDLDDGERQDAEREQHTQRPARRDAPAPHRTWTSIVVLCSSNSDVRTVTCTFQVPGTVSSAPGTM